MTTTAPAPPAGRTTTATGPRTAEGKAVSARSALADPEGATTHGLFCRQTVLPHLGEGPEAYQTLLDTLKEQLRPRNLMETQTLELWADASWKLRRLSRRKALAWEDDALGEDERLTKRERLARLQSGLRRQRDKAVRLLSQDVPGLYAQRTREDVMAKRYVTETLCAQEAFRRTDVERPVQANLRRPPLPDALLPSLDNTHAPTDVNTPARPDDGDNGICQNELAPADAPAPPGLPVRAGGPGERGTSEPGDGPPPPVHKLCQNEPDAPAPPGTVSPLLGQGGLSCFGGGAWKGAVPSPSEPGRRGGRVAIHT